MGNMEYLDEKVHEQPEEVQTIINSFDDNKGLYRECERLLIELEPLGYSFEYGLDGSPYNLTKTITP